MRSVHLAALALVASFASCATVDPDPVVLVRTSHGVEHGVSTTHGVVFLGSTSNTGEAELVAWFGDGPNIEPTLIESLGDGIYTLPVEIDLPSVAIDFTPVAPGARLIVRGRNNDGPWKREVRRAAEVPARGLLLDPPAEALPASSRGAGVFSRDARGDLRLVGLLSGRATIKSQGLDREVLCAVGALDLWRVVTYPRNRHRPQPWVYRDDVQ